MTRVYNLVHDDYNKKRRRRKKVLIDKWVFLLLYGNPEMNLLRIFVWCNSLEKVGDNKRGQSANKISEGNYRLELSR